ncbi:MAG: RnfABCDGE type electron transport complex subunit G [Clostridia bacterium]|nr:RnfABCDGE type electron transport complex subunit G [Clostridia bacterium]
MTQAVKAKKKEPSIAKLGIILFIITFCVALVLGFVNSITKDQIAYQAQLEIQNAIASIYPDASETTELAVPADVDKKRISSVYAAYGADGEFLGFAVASSPNGFGGAIDLMVGVLPDGSVKSVRVLSTNSETPGLGTRVAEEGFITQYDNKPAPIAVIKNGEPGDSEILAITGATISSTAVTTGVNLAVDVAAEVAAQMN